MDKMDSKLSYDNKDNFDNKDNYENMDNYNTYTIITMKTTRQL